MVLDLSEVTCPQCGNPFSGGREGGLKLWLSTDGELYHGGCSPDVADQRKAKMEAEKEEPIQWGMTHTYQLRKALRAAGGHMGEEELVKALKWKPDTVAHWVHRLHLGKSLIVTGTGEGGKAREVWIRQDYYKSLGGSGNEEEADQDSE